MSVVDSSAEAPEVQTLKGAPLNEREKVIHVLNRLAFGPRPGEVDKVLAEGGWEKWVDQQRESAHTPTDSMQSRGLEVFLTGQCAMCHSIEGTSAGSHAGPDLTHLAFEVEDLEVFARPAASKGYPLSDGPTQSSSGSVFAFVDAPEGYEIELIQRRKDGSKLPV